VASVDPTEARNNEPNQCYSSGFSPASVTHVVCSRIRPGRPAALNRVQYPGRPNHAEALTLEQLGENRLNQSSARGAAGFQKNSEAWGASWPDKDPTRAYPIQIRS
jgi:hypothetical protein